ncbi:UV excision repair protein Rad23 containing protein [Aphelenchoides avenae]|nr:UV excision repair protein Rad23 containing protein [Aphelenchus avenae]
MIVKFRTLNQQQFQLEVEESVTVGELKKKIAEQDGMKNFHAEHQKLIFSGKILANEQQFTDVGYAEDKFIVVMMMQKKPEVEPTQVSETASTSAASSAEIAAKASTPANSPTRPSSTASTAAAAVPSTVPPQIASVSPEHEAAVEAVTSMGYPREEALRALRAAFFNVDRAVEYLCTGIPDGLNQEPAAPAAEPPVGGGLEFLRNDPAFLQLRQLIRANPQSMPEILAQVAQTNPELMTAIRNNQAAFAQMLNEDVPAAAGGGTTGVQGTGGAPGQQVVTVDVTPEDMEVINRLKAMGFPEQLVIEAFITCDKNEHLALNYIISRIEEHQQQQGRGGASGGNGSSSSSGTR